MVVCVCAESREKDIEKALDAGACSLDEIGDRCGAGRDCGLCHEALLAMLGRGACGPDPCRRSLPPATASRATPWLERSAP